MQPLHRFLCNDVCLLTDVWIENLASHDQDEQGRPRVRFVLHCPAHDLDAITTTLGTIHHTCAIARFGFDFGAYLFVVEGLLREFGCDDGIDPVVRGSLLMTDFIHTYPGLGSPMTPRDRSDEDEEQDNPEPALHC